MPSLTSFAVGLLVGFCFAMSLAAVIADGAA